MRVFIGLFFLFIGIPVFLVAFGSLFYANHFELGALMFGAPLTLVGLYCLFGPERGEFD